MKSKKSTKKIKSNLAKKKVVKNSSSKKVLSTASSNVASLLKENIDLPLPEIKKDLIKNFAYFAFSILVVLLLKVLI